MENEIKIKKGLKVGELEAEADHKYLNHAFIDNGTLDLLVNTNEHASIIVGRTGTGKSALIYKISATVENSIYLDPNNISISFLENSNIIQFLTELGIKLDLFYRLLWRHILVLELIKKRYNIKDTSENKNFLQRISNWGGKSNPKRELAITYFRDWGEKFWQDTEEHIKEITDKFTSDVKAAISTSNIPVDYSLSGAKSLSSETKMEIKNLATKAVNQIQIQKLNEVLEALGEEAFDDNQKKYHILIDKLDENWAETETRCRFIRALIEEIKVFRKLQQIKIIAALRQDLLEIILDNTRDSGFQQEKYEAYFVYLKWNKEDLKKLLEERVSKMYEYQYTKKDVRFDDIFPKIKQGQMPIDYIIERTLLRPRDIIQFANECFLQSESMTTITWRKIAAAEHNYSKKRLQSLIEEWGEYYPSLKYTIEILREIPSTFTRSQIDNKKIEDLSAELYDLQNDDPCIKIARNLYDKSTSSSSDFLNQLLVCFYTIGLIGIKTSSTTPFLWSYIDQNNISKSEAKRANQIKIHKMYRQALDIRDNRYTNENDDHLEQ
ncbi:MAG: hypothetical protein Q4G28_02735 [Neisseria sp.]|nr:hypothetical protein [Neisseria sp.]